MPFVRQYVVKLTADERHALEAIVRKGTVAAQKRRHATILLGVDEGKRGPALSDSEVAETIGVTKRTVERTRERCVSDGLELALQRKPRTRERTRRLDGEAEARLVQLACSEAPEGRARWTLRLLADKLVELEIVDSVAHETVRRVLKKHHQTLAP